MLIPRSDFDAQFLNRLNSVSVDSLFNNPASSEAIISLMMLLVLWSLRSRRLIEFLRPLNDYSRRALPLRRRRFSAGTRTRDCRQIFIRLGLSRTQSFFALSNSRGRGLWWRRCFIFRNNVFLGTGRNVDRTKNTPSL